MLLFAAESSGPIADAADGVEGQLSRTRVLPAQKLRALHLGARDELLAREGVREVALVQALDVAVGVDLHLPGQRRHVQDGAAVVVIFVVGRGGAHPRGLGPRSDAGLGGRPGLLEGLPGPRGRGPRRRLHVAHREDRTRRRREPGGRRRGGGGEGGGAGVGVGGGSHGPHVDAVPRPSSALHRT